MTLTFPSFGARIYFLVRNGLRIAWYRAAALHDRRSLKLLLSHTTSLARTIIGVGKPSILSNTMPQTRWDQCRGCILFDHTLETCGTPGRKWQNPQTGREEQAGCLCWMRHAVWLKGKNCWFYEVSQGTNAPGIGWDRELNGDECRTGKA